MLRRRKPVAYIRRCIQLAHKPAFRIVEFAVQTNHVHLIVEAEDSVALSRGMQGLKMPITSPRQARHCLAYLLGNARKHAAQVGRTLARGWIDPFSSAPTFTGWAVATITGDGATKPGITRAPAFWLLRSAWRRYGPVDPDEVPGPMLGA